MFFAKKPKDCIELLNANKNVLGKPFHNRFLASAMYSYPSSKDQEVMARIFHQKKLIDEHGVFETVFYLARNTAFIDDYIKFTDKFKQELPHWSDRKSFSQTSATFTLNGISYIAEQHSSNFNSLVCLYRNQELIFAATLIGHRADENDAIAIANSKLDLDELKLLIDFANLSEEVGKARREASWNNVIEQQTIDYESKVKQNF